MEHTIILTVEQEEAFKNLGTSLEEYVASQIEYVTGEYTKKKAVEVYLTIQADPELKSAVEAKIVELQTIK